MKAGEIREKSIEQLYKDLTAKQEELRVTRFKSVYREITDKSVKSKVRRDIARIMTIIREKEVARILESAK